MKAQFNLVSILVIGAVSAAVTSSANAQNKFWGATSSTAPVYAPAPVQPNAAPIVVPAASAGTQFANTITIPPISGSNATNGSINSNTSTTTSVNTFNSQVSSGQVNNQYNANMVTGGNTLVQQGDTSIETIYSPNYIPQQQQQQQRFVAPQPVAYAAPQPVPTATGQSVQYFVGYKQKVVPQVEMRTVQVPVQKTRMVSVKRTIMVPKEITEQKMVPYQAFESREQQYVVPKTVQVPQYYRANYYTKVYRGPIQSVETLPAEIQAQAGTSYGAAYQGGLQQNGFAATSGQIVSGQYNVGLLNQGQMIGQPTPLIVNSTGAVAQ